MGLTYSNLIGFFEMNEGCPKINECFNASATIMKSQKIVAMQFSSPSKVEIIINRFLQFLKTKSNLWFIQQMIISIHISFFWWSIAKGCKIHKSPWRNKCQCGNVIANYCSCTLTPILSLSLSLALLSFVFLSQNTII